MNVVGYKVLINMQHVVNFDEFYMNVVGYKVHWKIIPEFEQDRVLYERSGI